jgi:hypothetical protein
VATVVPRRLLASGINDDDYSGAIDDNDDGRTHYYGDGCDDDHGRSDHYGAALYNDPPDDDHDSDGGGIELHR